MITWAALDGASAGDADSAQAEDVARAFIRAAWSVMDVDADGEVTFAEFTRGTFLAVVALEVQVHAAAEGGGTPGPVVATDLNDLASLLHDQGKYDEAELVMREALEISRRALGDEHPITMGMKRGLEEILSERDSSETPPTEDSDG